jgi:hypothetical protein
MASKMCNMREVYEMEIKPCPFCGGEASLITGPKGKYYIVFCIMANCPVEPCTAKYPTPEEAIQAWNQRV